MRSSMIPSWEWSPVAVGLRGDPAEDEVAVRVEQGVAPLAPRWRATIRRATSASMGRVRGWWRGGCFAEQGGQFHLTSTPSADHPGCSPCPPRGPPRAVT